MARKLLSQLGLRAHALRDQWYARPFAAVFADARLWSLQRRSITSAFGAGLAICFIPLPVHILAALAVAAAARVNVPTIIGTIFLMNPVTAVPVYYCAYRLGCLLLQTPSQDFAFTLSWDWLQHGLGPMWKPFLIGCLVCSILTGLAGWFALDQIWIRRVRNNYRNRRVASTR